MSTLLLCNIQRERLKVSYYNSSASRIAVASWGPIKSPPTTGGRFHVPGLHSLLDQDLGYSFWSNHNYFSTISGCLDPARVFLQEPVTAI